MNKKIAIIAGEKSGDFLGSRLMKAIKLYSGQPIDFIGVGGKNMEKLGFKSLFNLEDISIMGFFEIVPHLFKILSRIKQTVEFIKQEKPDVLITIDAPDFTFRIAQRLRNSGIKLVHYVAPSVWAYRPERAKKLASVYDLLLTLWPFEPHFFTSHGLRAEFIGNAFLENIAKINRAQFRHENDISRDTTLICVMPGSRKAELRRMLPCFSETLKELNKKIYDLTVVIPTISKEYAELIRYTIKGAPYRVIVTEQADNVQEILAAADFGLIKSGTSALQVAASLTPMVIGYKANPLTMLFAKMIIKVRYANIINIIRNRPIIPEFIQSQCNSTNLSTALYELYINRSKAKEQMDEAIKVLTQVGLNFRPTPSEKAARLVLEILF